ncbi:Glycoside hydrolase [Parasponia andersonii]|uniref:Glycoside hydrolase n=1 Tax=Parasponia andersonii TaxID=3476 RepID=A0A2P5D8L3_PARAD|nr:Glycoside hydrolase [Parasponia andersonii]
MAKGASHRLFLLFVSLLISYSSGTEVGFSHRAGRTTRQSSLDETISFLKENNVSPSEIRVVVTDHKLLTTLSNTGASVDLYLSQNQLQNLIRSKSSFVSWLKTHVISFLPHVNVKSIVATTTTTTTTSNTRHNELPKLLSNLKSLHSGLSSLGADNQVQVSAAFPLSFFKNLSSAQEEQLSTILSYIKEKMSFIIVEATMDEEMTKTGNGFVESLIQIANSATSSVLPNDVPMVLTIKSHVLLNPKEVAEFSDKVTKSLQHNTRISGKLIGLYAELLTSAEDFEESELKRAEEQVFHTFSRRQLLTKLDPKTTTHDTIFPTTPTIVTVPSTNPVTITPANPLDTTPVPFPLTTPVTVPATYPTNTPVPITVPGAQPITNPVTTYPAPVGTVPTTTPVTTNPIPPPATTNSPAVPGQSWCVAKTGSPETALQAALDYACGGGADCSQIQQGGACYNPNTLQNHASYAFNSYYQKNPAPTSCDFGGTATLVSANPSTGSCIYPTSSSSTPASPSTPTPVTPTPYTPTPVTPTPTVTNPAAGTPSPSWGVVSGSGTSPPTVLNSSTGTTPDFGLDSPPGFNSSTSKAGGLRPFIGFIFLVTSFVTRNFVMGI